VEFWDVEKVASGELVEKCEMKVAREKFDASCSFDMRRYQEAVVVANPAGFRSVKLGDILTGVKGTEVITLEKAIPGDFPLYSASVDVRTHNKAGFTGEESIIQACVGSNLVNCIHYVSTPFATTANLWVLRKVEGCELSLKYVYYYLLHTKAVLKKVNTSVLPKINKGDFDTIEIPLPPLHIQEEIVQALDLIYNNAATAKAAAASTKAQMAAVMRSVGARGFEKKKLGDVSEWKMGERIVKSKVESGTVPVYGGGGITFYTNSSNRSGVNCKISREGMSEKNCVLMINGEYHQNSQGMTVVTKDTNTILNGYLWNWLLTNKKSVFECGQGSAQMAINMSALNNLSIVIPPLPIQQEVLTTLNEMEAELKVMEQMATKAEQRAKYILDGYLAS